MKTLLLTKAKIINVYDSVFGKDAQLKVKPNRVTKKGRLYTEIIRAWFGDDDSQMEDNCKKFLQDGLHIDLNDVETKLGRFAEASGSYVAFKITPKKKGYQT